MYMYRILVLETIIAIFIGGLTYTWNRNVWMGLAAVAVIICPYPAIVIFHKKYQKQQNLKKAGVIDYFENFDSKTDCKIFSRESPVKESFCYFGASTNTILELLKQWVAYNPAIHAYRFLLINPESLELKKQIAFETNIPESEVSNAVIEAEKNRINSAIQVLQNLQPYKEKKLEIRLYSQFVPCWFYLTDDRIIYLGILKKGKRNDQAVILTEKQNDNSTLFDVYKNTWDCIWSDATPVV